ncbi:Hypothetical_protein [Hexamita inflata]|uniref:Hypothetical_protein n=1 Tax=Hexamita inflata TaxID=28002 RepID=A0AA86PB76_9EUKA|nr:Hypothetical protein HINF_LOCUS22166 [Hexamita inflata]
MEQSYIINPLSHLGQLMIQYYGTTDVGQIGKQDADEEKLRARKLRQVQQIPSRINLRDVSKASKPKQYQLIQDQLKNGITIKIKQTYKITGPVLNQQIIQANETRNKLMEMLKNQISSTTSDVQHLQLKEIQNNIIERNSTVRSLARQLNISLQ